MSNKQEEELLEIWDWEGAFPTGKAVSRSVSHRDGVPHEGVHLWVYRNTGTTVEVLFQHRALTKKMYPDCLDITVGGHVPFGLAEKKIQKEAEEEIGIIPEDKDLVDLGFFRYEERDETVFHREFQHVYLISDNRPLDSYSFRDGEVIGIYAVPLENLDRLMNEDHFFPVSGYDGASVFTKTVSRADFHPLLFSPIMKEYMDIVLQGIRAVSRGQSISRVLPLTPGQRKP